uniref:LamG-like jellyroll fold domain-containing protein n=1 Tax=viral metagenome TaxID=1070528 RepID=A0A6C0B674_9ZZZZ
MNQEPVINQTNNILNQGIQGVSDAISSVKNQVSAAFNDFSSQPNASSEFSYSNTIIAKFAFLLLVIILFMYFINLGINLISYYISPGSNPYLIRGIQQGTFPLQIPQNPNATGSITLMRSNNESTGAEFTWSIWLYIDDLTLSNSKSYQHIFNKGDAPSSANNGISLVNNAPGLYLGNGGDNSKPINTLHIIMDTVGVAVKSNNNNSTTPTSSGMKNETLNNGFMNPSPGTIDIPNVPLKKWFHVAIRLENSILDVYVNGTIDQRQILSNVPKQNYFDVFVCQNGGFQGSLSDLRYFNSALNVFQINTIVSKGPNMETSSQYATETRLKDYHYLSSLWYPI